MVSFGAHLLANRTCPQEIGEDLCSRRPKKSRREISQTTDNHQVRTNGRSINKKESGKLAAFFQLISCLFGRNITNENSTLQKGTPRMTESQFRTRKRYCQILHNSPKFPPNSPKKQKNHLPKLNCPWAALPTLWLFLRWVFKWSKLPWALVTAQRPSRLWARHSWRWSWRVGRPSWKTGSIACASVTLILFEGVRVKNAKGC